LAEYSGTNPWTISPLHFGHCILLFVIVVAPTLVAEQSASPTPWDKRWSAKGPSHTSRNATLTFRHSYNLESSLTNATGFDEGVLENLIDGGAFVDSLAAGTSFTAGSYDRTISDRYRNPLADRAR
jgi:hypothetical protein